MPIGRSPDVDFVASDGARLIRVQVKTSGSRTKYERWAVAICTRGGNQSWSGVVKRFAATRCDELFVVTVDGRRWRIPSEAVESTTAMHLGGVKYAQFEVEAGPTLTAPPACLPLASSTAAG